jgi:hypothetical protein
MRGVEWPPALPNTEMACIRLERSCLVRFVYFLSRGDWLQPGTKGKKKPRTEDIVLTTVIMFFEHDSVATKFTLPSPVVTKLEHFAFCLFN